MSLNKFLFWIKRRSFIAALFRSAFLAFLFRMCLNRIMDESNNMGGGGNTTNQTNQGDGQKVFFDSYNIGRKEKAQYFPGEEGKKKEAKGIAKLFEGKNKFITITVIAVLIILIAILLLWLIFWRSDDRDGANSPSDDSDIVVSIPEDYDDILNEAFLIYDSNASSEHAYDYVLTYINDKVATAQDSHSRFLILMIYANICFRNEDYNRALDYLLGIDMEGLEDSDRAAIYDKISVAYSELGNSEQAGYYLEQANYFGEEYGDGGNE